MHIFYILPNTIYICTYTFTQKLINLEYNLYACTFFCLTRRPQVVLLLLSPSPAHPTQPTRYNFPSIEARRCQVRCTFTLYYCCCCCCRCIVVYRRYTHTSIVWWRFLCTLTHIRAFFLCARSRLPNKPQPNQPSYQQAPTQYQRGGGFGSTFFPNTNAALLVVLCCPACRCFSAASVLAD